MIHLGALYNISRNLPVFIIKTRTYGLYMVHLNIYTWGEWIWQKKESKYISEFKAFITTHDPYLDRSRRAACGNCCLLSFCEMNYVQTYLDMHNPLSPMLSSHDIV